MAKREAITKPSKVALSKGILKSKRGRLVFGAKQGIFVGLLGDGKGTLR
jgi:hypothetical protein